MGAEEIEFDLWVTKDGEIVSCHDDSLDRVSTGTGKVYEHTYKELLEYDFGVKFSEKFKGLKILKFEDILRKFSCHTIMNIHIKTPDNKCEYSPEALRKIIELIDKYDCIKYVYFMSGNDNLLRLVEAEAGGEDLIGKMLVANVVLNRVEDKHFPSSINEVIFQSNNGVTQFSPISDGRFYSVKVTDETIEAVNLVLQGEDNSQGALYFAARKAAGEKKMRWFDEKLQWLFAYGGHEFFF